jgi:uncharacterized protein (TIGR02246 family)
MNIKKVEFGLEEARAKKIAIQLGANLDKAWDERDAKALARLFQENADFQWETGQIVRGCDEIEECFASRVFPTLPDTFQHRVIVQQARPINREVFIGDGEIEIYDSTESDLQQRVRQKYQCTTVAVKENNIWFISAVRLMVPN